MNLAKGHMEVLFCVPASDGAEMLQVIMLKHKMSRCKLQRSNFKIKICLPDTKKKAKAEIPLSLYIKKAKAEIPLSLYIS